MILAENISGTEEKDYGKYFWTWTFMYDEGDLKIQSKYEPTQYFFSDHNFKRLQPRTLDRHPCLVRDPNPLTISESAGHKASRPLA